MACEPTKVCAFEDSGVSLMARMRGNDGNYITRASLNVIGVKVFDKSDLATALQDTTLTIANVVFDTLQTDSRWTEDTTGYNFRHDVLASWLSGGNKTYRIEYRFDPNSGDDFYKTFDVRTAPIYGS